MTTPSVLPILWRRRLTLVLTFIATLGAAAAVTFSLENVYSSTGYIAVSLQRETSSDFEATQAIETITKTFAELLQSRNTAERVSQRLPFPASTDEMLASTEIFVVPDTQLIAITASADASERAQVIANTYAGTFIVEARELTRLNGISGNATLAAAAPNEPSPVRPQPLLYLVIGAVIAAVAGAAAALLHHRLDQRLEIGERDTEVLGLPVLARIPRRPSREIAGLVRGNAPGGRGDRGVAESFRLLFVNLSFANLGERPATIAVVSSTSQEGKSTCSVSIARAATELGLATLLVDADLRRPSLTEKLGGDVEHRQGGLSSLLVRSTMSLDEGIVDVPVEGRSMGLMPSGPVPPNPAALLGSARLLEVHRRAQRAYELVVYDTPPLSVGADASVIASTAEGVILVIDHRNTRRPEMVQAIEQLRRTRANILGVVVNRAPNVRSSAYDYYDTPAGDALPLLPPDPVLEAGERRA
ncbi:MAG: polysaccharide biosynthesis tyrosine autokinase [Actinomycetota bacterium]|nr:polysaccharide biosynthesis tyrosine autokinase [Actinomycetota bacterium]